MLKAIRTVHQDAVIIIKTGSFYNVYGVENINKYLLKNLNDKPLIEKIEKVINEGRKI